MSDVLRSAIEEEGGLATASDLARLWGVTEARVRQLVQRDPDFPRPVTSVTHGRSALWSMEDAQQYRPAS